ncbi:MAG: phosphonoacetaldehyde hydrolase [Succinivibrio sp.]
MRKPEAVIFDWAGTTIDFGSMAPVDAIRGAFITEGIEVTDDEIRAPMGMLKHDHLSAMLHMPRIATLFHERFGRDPGGDDIDRVYAAFEKSLMEQLPSHCDLKPHLLEAVGILRDKGIAIGSTTGYTREMMEAVTAGAAEAGYRPDAVFTAEDVGGFGRPRPYMIFRNLEALGVTDVRNAIKIGDTPSDIREGRNAGVFSVGVAEGSSAAGMDAASWARLGAEERSHVLHRAARALYEAGADLVIRDLSGIKVMLEAFKARA